MAPQVISFKYTLTDKSGKVLDQSQEGHPLVFISGSGQIIPGLEHTLVAMDSGSRKTITVPAQDAYGLRNSQLVYKVSRKELPLADIKIGDLFEVGQGEHVRPVSIVAIDEDQVTLDGNHPLAGQDLTFAVEIVSKRSATPEEISHGHAHGTGGCHH